MHLIKLSARFVRLLAARASRVASRTAWCRLGIPLAVAVVTLPALLPGNAAASGSGCTNDWNFAPNSPTMTNSCVAVNGSGLYVSSVVPGVEFDSGTVTGRFLVRGPGFSIYTKPATYVSSPEAKGPVINLKRNIHPGHICATWLTAVAGSYEQIGYGPACITVHS